MVLAATLANADDLHAVHMFCTSKEAWLRGFLRLENGVPCYETFRRILQSLNPVAFQHAFQRWTQSVADSLDGQVVPIDGKALRGSASRARGTDPIRMVSAWAADQGLVLAQVKVDDKSNEITAIPQLLNRLVLEGALVTIDAIGCQKEIAAKVVEAKADYALALKANQRKLHAQAHEAFEQLPWPEGSQPLKAHKTTRSLPPPKAKRGSVPLEFRALSGSVKVGGKRVEVCGYEQREGGHGREQTRRFWVLPRVDWIEGHKEWAGLKALGMVECERWVRGKRRASVERRYYVLSFENELRFAKAVRSHWQVENALHWRLDVTFGEDQVQVRDEVLAENLSTLRRIALNVLKQDTSGRAKSIRQRRHAAAYDERYLLEQLKRVPLFQEAYAERP